MFLPRSDRRGRAPSPVFCALALGAVALALVGCDASRAPRANQAHGDRSGPRADHTRQPVREWLGWHAHTGTADAPIVLPEALPASPETLWSRSLTAPTSAGVAASTTVVVVADKTHDLTHDCWRCFRASDGTPIWEVEYPADGDMDYTNAPRATPLILEERVIVLGAFGDLYCLSLADGTVIWSRDLVRDAGGKVPMWGFCTSPLCLNGAVVVGAAGAETSWVAVDVETGRIVRRGIGKGINYGNFALTGILAESQRPDRRREASTQDHWGVGPLQLIGWDSEALHGWDLRTGEAIWSWTPPDPPYYVVPTPVVNGESLVVASQDLGVMRFELRHDDQLAAEPVAACPGAMPDIATPVPGGTDRLFVSTMDGLFCLDADALAIIWSNPDPPFNEYSAIIGGRERILVTTLAGTVALLDANAPACTVLSRWDLFDGVDVWSHPALVGDRLYIRGPDDVRCIRISDDE